MLDSILSCAVNLRWRGGGQRFILRFLSLWRDSLQRLRVATRGCRRNFHRLHPHAICCASRCRARLPSNHWSLHCRRRRSSLRRNRSRRRSRLYFHRLADAATNPCIAARLPLLLLSGLRHWSGSTDGAPGSRVRRRGRNSLPRRASQSLHRRCILRFWWRNLRCDLLGRRFHPLLSGRFVSFSLFIIQSRRSLRRWRCGALRQCNRRRGWQYLCCPV